MNTDPRLDPNADPACRDEDPEIFFPLTGRNDVAEIAKAICRRCPVQNQCLAWALETRQQDGILGGHTKKERRALNKKAADRSLLGDLLRERAGDPDALLKEMVHPPVLISGWAES